MTPYLKSIYIYPIKGLRGLLQREALVEPRGLVQDRCWMLVDQQNRFLSQRKVPVLVRLVATATEAGLRLSAAGAPELEVARPGKEAPRLKVRIWRDVVQAACAREDANQWFSDVTGQPCRLVYMDDPAARPVDPAHNPGDAVVSFADGFPVLLTSEQSLASLNERMAEPVSMLRFRPNVTVDGFAPFAEDGWREIQIGDVRFSVVKPCSRCVVTTIDQETAKAGKEPLRTLSTFRKRGGNVYFGENLVPQGQGIIRTGDAVTILSCRMAAQRFF